jgi:class 3 adenylate cyclase/tetratricopeptide (TPR) repeat protein
MQVCAGCGESNPGRFKECAFCGEPLAARTETTEERKVLTVIFCDLKGSTALGEALDPESLSEVLELYFKSMTRVLERHGGSIQKFIGDAIVCAFGIPLLHEDDALRAVRAASEMIEQLGRLNGRLQTGYGVQLAVRIGIYTGEVLVRTPGEGQQILTGDTMNTAARLEQNAGTDQILIGEPTYRLVRDAVEVEAVEPIEAKGKSEPLAAYRLVRVFGDEQASRRHDAPIVGRQEELLALLSAFGRAREQRHAELATVLGEAGVGKSRLVRAVLEAVETESRILRSRCLPYGEGITFLPLLGIMREAADIDQEDPVEVASAKLDSLTGDPEVTRRLASAVGWSKETLPVAEIYWAARELLQAVAADQPLVVVIDDVHWAEQSLLELIEHVVDSVTDATVLIMCTARPDMLERLPEWSEGPRANRLLLERLPDEAAAEVIGNLLGGVELPAQIRQTIIRAAEGNPLFVEQLVSMLIDSKLLVEVDGGWQAQGSLDRLQVPPSIHALLTARLDMLHPQERAVVEPASIIGLEFGSQALRDLSPDAVRDAVPVHLATMERKQLVRPTTDSDGDRELDDYRFHHILIRDAAYQRALKRTRAELHERFGDWLEGWDAEHDRAGEHDEIVGYHLEQAYIYGGQLGPIDAQVAALGARAADKLAAAGQRAFARGDLPAAVNLLGRAVATLPANSPTRLALIPDLAEATMETGEFERAIEILAEAEHPAAVESNEPAVVRAGLIRLMIDFYAGSEEDWAERVTRATEPAMALFNATDQHSGLATAWRLRYAIEATALRWDDAAEAAEHVIHHAEAVGDRRQQRRGASGLALSAVHGWMPVRVGIERCEELIPRVEGDRVTQAGVQSNLALLLAMDGQIDRARDLYRDAQRLFAEIGPSVWASATSTEAASVELLAGDLDAAERQLRSDNDQLAAFGENYLRSSVVGILARVMLLKGAQHEAEHYALECRSIAAPDDIDAQVLWRSTLARRRALQGEHDEALGLANEAIQLASASRAALLDAQSLSDRGFVSLAAGRRDEAYVDFALALEKHRAKGNVTEAGAVQRVLDELPGPSPDLRAPVSG